MTIDLDALLKSNLMPMAEAWADYQREVFSERGIRALEEHRKTGKRALFSVEPAPAVIMLNATTGKFRVIAREKISSKKGSSNFVPSDVIAHMDSIKGPRDGYRHVFWCVFKVRGDYGCIRLSSR